MKITKRETEILDLISWGFSDKEIALQLNISARTVQTHVERAREKLEARNRTHAVTLFLMINHKITQLGKLVNT